MILTERTKSLASVRTRFAIADGGANWETFSIFGGSTASTLANLAGFPNGVPSTLVGAPTIGTAGVTVSGTNALQIEQMPDAGSETIYLVVDPGAATPTNGADLFSNWNGDYTSCTLLTAGAGFFGIYANVAFLDSGATPRAIGSQLANSYTSATGNPTYSGPQCFVIRIDMAAMLITVKNLTRPNQLTTYPIPAGYTRPASTKKYRLGGYKSTTGTSIVYAFGKRSGASTDAQDALMYGQFQANLAVLGITI